MGEAPSAPPGARSANMLLNDGAFELYGDSRKRTTLGSRGSVRKKSPHSKYKADSAACDRITLRKANGISFRRSKEKLGMQESRPQMF